MFGRSDSVRIPFPFAVFVGALLTCTFCAFVLVQDASAAAEKTAEMAWVRQADTTNTVLYASLQADEWSKPVKLSGDNQLNLVPTLASDNQGKTFVAWTVINRAGSNLFYVTLRDDVVENKSVKIATGLSSNMAPFLAVDLDGIPWLVWSGNNGTTSDVYFSRFENGIWLPPQRVHAKNDVPDILPELRVDPDGAVFVRWKTYGENGYSVVTKKMKDTTISSAAHPLDTGWTKDAGADPLACIKTLPAGYIELDKAALLSRCLKDRLPLQKQFRGTATR